MSKPITQLTVKEFIQLESASGLLLLGATIIALVFANTQLAFYCEKILGTPVAIQVGALAINKPLLLRINDGLMAIFFFLVSLEIKREFLEGELSSLSQVILPGMGALGGMIVSASIYIWFNWGDPEALSAWAIPVATDIAFALALLSTFGSRVPVSLKIFLLTLAIFDDLAAVVIIAVFYSQDLSSAALLLAVAMNRAKVTRTSSYILLGIVLWMTVLKSGVHATLAGVLIALCIPMRDQEGNSPLQSLEHDLQAPVAFVILPVFALANAGLALGDISWFDITHPVTLGITWGLVIGKPVGILLFVGLSVASGLACLPKCVNWLQLLGAAFTCGVGFTMSLFIAGLAFEHGSGTYFSGDRLGILLGSALSALAGYLVLHLALPKAEQGTAS